MTSYGIYLSLSDLFHLACCPPSSSVWLQEAKLPSFLWLSSIPLCVCVCLCVSHVLAIVSSAAMNIEALSTSYIIYIYFNCLFCVGVYQMCR